ncbi:MAG: deoxyribose-phosphate aldolase [Clostridiales Family XIII bacterium]|jgi:deoxyribose-phosphate aldolase|nr:deoxyribose-phosphate aldolase [Clostridiales Family XIII bacterium]
MDIDSIIKQVTAELCGKLDIPATGSQDLEYSPASLAKYIDHTILKADASLSDVTKVCDEAKKFNFASVCVNSGYIKFVADYLQGSGATPCCVVGFPLGAMIPEAKADETARSVADGAKEIDMVVNVGAIKSDDWKLVLKDIEGVVNAAKGRAIVKVIIEACLLTDEEKVKACAVSKLAGAHFVKTSTGFSTGGATVEDVKLMRETVGPDIGVKASGGVRTYEDAVAMIKAGATRLGTSNGSSIVAGPSTDGNGVSNCVNCGACRNVCPTGRTAIIKQY